MEYIEGKSVDALKKDLKNLKSELRNYSEQVETLKALNVFFAREVEVRKKLKDVVTKNNKKTNPAFEFENTPEFMKLQAELDEIGIDKMVFDLELKIHTNDRTIENNEEELARIRKHIPIVEEKLSKVGE